MTPVGDSAFARALRALARVVCRRPGWFIWPQVALFVLSVIYTATHFTMDMNRDNLVAGPTHSVYMKYREEFPGEDQLIVIAESGQPDRNRQFMERLAARVRVETNLYTDLFYKGDLPDLGRKALLFASESDLKEMLKTLKADHPFLQQFSSASTLEGFFELVNKQFRTAKDEDNADNEAMANAIPALRRIVEQATDSLSRPGTPVSPGVAALFGDTDEAEKRVYITFADGRLNLLTVRPRNADVVEEGVDRMRELIRQTEAEVPGLNAGLTGEPVLDVDEMRQSTVDSIKATVISLVICSLIFIYAYREIWRPLKAVACLVVGLGYTMAFTFLVVRHLNILTITFAPILIGLAIDFGIHFITRYEEETRHGKSPQAAVEQATVFTGQGIITGALTTAMAFLAMGMTHFKGIQEMGIISGGGLVLCLIPMMTMLPALLMRGRQTPVHQDSAAQEQKRARIEDYWLQRPALVMAITVVTCAAALFEFRRVYFDYNLLKMQSKGLPAVTYLMKLLHSGQSIPPVSVIADNLEEARAIEIKTAALPSVASVDGSDHGDPIFALVTGEQKEKLALVNQIKSEVKDVDFAAPAPTAAAPLPSAPGGSDQPILPGRTGDPPAPDAPLHDLSVTLYRTMGYLGAAADYIHTERPDLAKQLLALHDAIRDFRVKLLDGGPHNLRKLAQYQTALFDDIRETFDTIKNQDTTGPLRPRDLPPALRNEFVGRTSQYKVEVFSKADIWEHTNQESFIAELQAALAPHGDKVTGTPVQLLEYTTLLKDSYQQAALYALAAIAVMVLLHFRSLPCVILSLLPVAVGSVWTAGFMGIAGIPFNPANIMVLPLVIGIGVTNGIHILNRVAEERIPTILAKSTGKAVLVSGLTALTGFGCLTLAKHLGIQSLGLVMAAGIAACLVAALTFLPAALNLLARWGWTVASDGKKSAEKKPSGDNARSPLGLEEPR